ncbi:hypothetical protein GCM10009619_14200 [Williamsia maris]
MRTEGASGGIGRVLTAGGDGHQFESVDGAHRRHVGVTSPPSLRIDSDDAHTQNSSHHDLLFLNGPFTLER